VHLQDAKEINIGDFRTCSGGSAFCRLLNVKTSV
jgi:hypothetical protein